MPILLRYGNRYVPKNLSNTLSQRKVVTDRISIGCIIVKEFLLLVNREWQDILRKPLA